MQIIDARHPDWLSAMTELPTWRLCYGGGSPFRDAFLKKFSAREDHQDFLDRREITPIPAFAKSAVQRIRNAVYQRLRDVSRVGGSVAYQRAVAGLDFGVDRRGSSMAAFIGMRVLEELLVAGKTGIYVDNVEVPGATLADAYSSRPYLYPYCREDILSWACTRPEEPSNFSSLLLRDTCTDYDGETGLPTTVVQRYRHLWIDEAGYVNVQFYNEDGEAIDVYGQPGGPVVLELTRIPFVLLDIGESLLKDVCSFQIALLNLASSDVSYAFRSNFPFLTEQVDPRGIGSHLRHGNTADNSDPGQAASKNIKIGPTQGRTYPIGAERPQYINPSSEPLTASLQLQQQLRDSIRELVNLAVENIAVRKGAESIDDGLEAGLSFIGLELESAERKIAEYWAAYEERDPSKRAIATISYPDQYRLKTDKDRIEESTQLSKLLYAVPGRKIKREIQKRIATSLLGGKIGVDALQEIYREIDSAEYTTSEPQTIIDARNAGLVGDRTASLALGFDDEEYIRAQEDHLARIARIAQSQGILTNGSDPASRGVPDASANPNAPKEEKFLSRQTDQRPSTRPRVRGRGRRNKE
jgi:hypothetical protein